jgi:hypothetical protein
MIPKPDADSTYQVFLLSLWRETPAMPWRATLRLANGQERMGFADLEELALFLLSLSARPTILPPAPDP